MEKLKLLELFGGIGACSKALERLGIDYEIVDYVEIDKYAVKSFNAIHNTNFELQDIKEWDKNVKVDLIMHGSPCFVKGTSILTDKSYKNIEDVKVGDYVLTHTNEYQKVLKIGYTDNKRTYRLKVKNCLEVQATENHPFYCIERERIQHHRNIEYKYSEPKWKELEDITTNDFVGINIPQNERNDYDLTPEQCYLLGRYVADGHLYNNKRQDRKNGYNWFVIYSIGATKLKDFESHIATYKYSKVLNSSNCYRVMIWDKKLVEFIKKYGFGEGAINKDIPQIILDLPKSLAKYFLDGYMSGDGSYNETIKVYRATTISKKLILKLQLLVAKIFNQPSSVTFSRRPSKHIIENRMVNQHDTYSIQYKITPEKAYSFIKDNKLWFKVSKIEKANKERVYNLEIEKDNSYTANNLIVHNCQDFSLAGKQAGGDKDSGTRSSLMYETIRIVEKLKPKYVVWENVKNLLSKKHRHNFDAYLETMERLGYTNYYQVLNAKDYGIPQNRERVFTISIRNDVDADFKFPPKQELKLKLKDILEDEVDEKYYLSERMIKYVSAIGTCGFKNPDSRINLDIARPLTTDPNKRAGTTNYLCDQLPDNYNLAVMSIVDGFEKDLRIRRLNPKEYWRLMGFDDEDFEKASKVNSNTQLYKQAGNSIVVNVLEAIFKNLFRGEKYEKSDD